MARPVRWYFLSVIILLLVSLVPMLIHSQEDLFLVINQHYNKPLDHLFFWITYLGDGLVFGIVILVLLFNSYSKAITGGVIFIGTSFMAQFIKRVIFSDQLRPVARLGESFDIHIPGGVTPLLHNSFPSGHSTTAFALATFLVLAIRRKQWWPALLGVAILVGYSRIYLSHHFPIDVWAGMIIGTGGAYLSYWWLYRVFERKFRDRSILKK